MFIYTPRFPADHVDSRLNFIVVNMLTVVAFLIILGGMLPEIPYLTTVDKYTICAFGYVFACAFCCVLFNYIGVEGTEFEDWFFIAALVLLFVVHGLLVLHYRNCRIKEMHKTTIDRHEVRIITLHFYILYVVYSIFSFHSSVNTPLIIMTYRWKKWSVFARVLLTKPMTSCWSILRYIH